METAGKRVKTNGVLVELVRVDFSGKLVSWEIFVNFMYYVLLEGLRYRLPEKLCIKL